MPLRRAALAALIATTSLLATSVTLAPSSRADDPPSSCTIVDTSPDTVVIGVTPKRVTFDIGTDCDDDTPVLWQAQGALVSTSAHVGWFGVCNYDYAGPQLLDCDHNNSAILNPIGEPVGINPERGNDMAGSQYIYAHAFIDTNGNQRDDDETGSSYSGTFTILRATTFGASFSASPSRQHKGQKITIKGQVQVADWDTGTYDKYGTYVTLQYRKNTWNDYSDVKQVWDNGSSATTTLKASKTGYYRYSIDATDTEAASVSKAVHVTATAPAHGDVTAVPASKPKPKTYANCTALNKVYAHGVGRKGAKDKVRGKSKPVTNFTVDTKTYNKNTKSDRDKDGIACEKR